MLLSMEHISKSFSGKPILRDISFTVEEGMRYGLIGVNGAGKSTLLNILIGEMEQDTGEISKSGNLTVGYLKQNSGLNRSLSLIHI